MPSPPGEYVVVARRYRPQVFEELIGQQHVARALSNAILTNRVGHAYLFTGARGVGKTSAARILAKALNCQQGTRPVPCNQCDVCQAIGSGDDVDVLEIDGASNRGIDEVRQLRQNANVRPSRARFKIYIIDEVHMLTREAFNALLKTLEEPPDHVKFIFCTTEPTKIPITILSRCQRFDFAGIGSTSIRERLAQIVHAEGVEADPEALEVIARRAAGSMRDAQSLLEQLLALAEKISVADVHNMLGTAGDERLARLVARLVGRDAAGALADLDAALLEGVDVSQLVEQLFGYLRDCMAAAAGASPETFLYSSPRAADQVSEAGRRLGLETILAAMQVLDHTLARMRYSTQGRVLAELALVRICCLEDLQQLGDLIEQVRGAEVASSSGVAASSPRRQPAAASAPDAPPPSAKKNDEPADLPAAEPPPRQAATARDAAPDNPSELWVAAIGQVSGLAAEQAQQYDRIANPAPNRLVVFFKPGYTLAKSICERPDQVARFEAALAQVTGRRIHVEFALAEDEPAMEPSPQTDKPVTPQQRLIDVVERPIVRRAGELFGAHPVRVDPPPQSTDP